MNNKLVIGIVAAVILIGGAVAVVSQRSSQNASPTTEQEMNMNQPTRPGPTQTPDSEVKSGKIEVVIENYEFKPAQIKVRKGTTVNWTNKDAVRHNAFSDDATGPKGQLLAKSESFSYTFDTIGLINYYCTPHPYMKGRVEVVE